MGLDIGFKDATAGIVLAYNFEDNKYYAVEEYMASEKTTDQHATAVRALEQKYGIQFIFIDSAAQQTRYDWAYNHDIATINANKSVLDGIAYCQSLIENDRLIVDSSCVNLLASLDQYRWDPNAALIKERPEHSEWSHMADALRYALYSYTTSITSV
jgi:phage terminase large subunit